MPDDIDRALDDVETGQVVEEVVEDLLSQSPLMEIGLKRLAHHFKGSTFGIVTPYRREFDEGTNRKRLKAMRDQLLGLGYGKPGGRGFAKVSGLWRDDEGLTPLERGFIIFGVPLAWALAIGKKYDQDAIVWGKEGRYNWYDSATGQVGERLDWNDFKWIGEPAKELGAYTGATAVGWRADPEQRAAAKALGVRGPAVPREVPAGLKALSFGYRRRGESLETEVFDEEQYHDLWHLIVVETDLSKKQHCLSNLLEGPHPGVIREDRRGGFWFQYIGVSGEPHSVWANRIVHWVPLLVRG